MPATSQGGWYRISHPKGREHGRRYDVVVRLGRVPGRVGHPGHRSGSGRCPSRARVRNRPARTAGCSAPGCTPGGPNGSPTCPTAHRWKCPGTSAGSAATKATAAEEFAAWVEVLLRGRHPRIAKSPLKTVPVAYSFAASGPRPVGLTCPDATRRVAWSSQRRGLPHFLDLEHGDNGMSE
jgi:hypothetical protein